MIGVAGCISLLMLGGFAVRTMRGEPGGTRIIFWSALAVRLGSGLLVGWIYLHFYTGDTFVYFSDASKLTALARTDLWGYLTFLSGNPHPVLSTLEYAQPRALFMVKLVSIINLITWDNYWITSLWFSFFSFFASWQLFITIRKKFEAGGLAAALAFLFFPSVVFWSSGVVKESIAVSALYLLSVIFLKRWFGDRFKWWEIIFTAIGLFLLWELKYYYAILFLPIALSALAAKWMPGMSSDVYRIIVFLALLVSLLLIGSFMHPNLRAGRFMEVIVENYNAFKLYPGSSKTIAYHQLEPNLPSMLFNAPWAVLSGFFRPFVFEAENVFGFLAGLENAFTILITATFVTSSFRNKTKPYRLIGLAVLLYSVLLCALLALSTPNFGTLIRFRVGFLPFFIFLVTYRNIAFERTANYIKRLVSQIAR